MTSAAITAAGLMNIDDSQEINEPNENIPFPSAADTGYLSIPAGAFIPVSEFESYTNNGFVCLPHGATVTELIFHWGDASPSYDGQLSLCVNYMTGWSDLMAECDTSGSS